MRILFITHNLSRTGAPINLLHTIRELKLTFKVTPIILVHHDTGNMSKEFAELGQIVYYGDKKFGSNKLFRKILNRLCFFYNLISIRMTGNIDAVYSNTICNGGLFSQIKFIFPGTRLLVHVHELENMISNWGDLNWNRNLKYASLFIAASDAVKSNLINNRAVNPNKIEVVKEYIDTNVINDYKFQPKIRSSLGQKKDDFIIGGCGVICYRKGTDLFIETAVNYFEQHPNANVRFVWLGSFSDQNQIYQTSRQQILSLGLEEKIIFINQVPDPLNYFIDFDIFYLSSREDPYPLVCLENAALGNPIICFENSGGIPEFVIKKSGMIVKGTMQAMQAIHDLVSDPLLLAKLGRNAKSNVMSNHDSALNVRKIMKLIESAA